MNNFWMLLGLLGCGGAGVVCRYGLGCLISSDNYPWSTLGINILGSFLMGMLFVLFTKHLAHDASWKLWVMTGFLGGFTTFSSFSLESLMLLQQGRVVVALSYVSSSVVLSLLACWVGMRLCV